jgi:hypothetical protein
MHFHLPKPLHGWRELFSEVGIIVIGVLIALGAEQLVEAWQWREKVQIARTAIRFELNGQLDQSDEVVRFGKCSGPFVDALEAAIIRHDKMAIGKLHDIQPPFAARPWPSTAWQSAMSTQVADHIPSAELSQYAFMFSSFTDILGLQNAIIGNFAEATTGRLGGPMDPVSTSLQLIAAEKLRTELTVERDIAAVMINTAAGRYPQWKPFHRQVPTEEHAAIEREGALCERTVERVSEAAR